jgi:hypothetical protein
VLPSISVLQWTPTPPTTDLSSSHSPDQYLNIDFCSCSSTSMKQRAKMSQKK